MKDIRILTRLEHLINQRNSAQKQIIDSEVAIRLLTQQKIISPKEAGQLEPQIYTNKITIKSFENLLKIIDSMIAEEREKRES